MRNRTWARPLWGALLFSISSWSALGQDDVQAFSPGVQERALTRVIYYSPSAQKVVGEFNIAYGPAAWKEQYGQSLEQLKGRIWRLGANFWTLLDTNLPLRFNGVSVPAGLHYLAVEQASDGRWNLALIDPLKARAARMDPSAVIADASVVPVAARAPLEFSKSEESVETLRIQLQVDQQDKSKASLTISWGNFRLQAPIAVEDLS